MTILLKQNGCIDLVRELRGKRNKMVTIILAKEVSGGGMRGIVPL